MADALSQPLLADPLTALGPLVMHALLSHLSAKELFTAGSVCKGWRESSKDARLWRGHVQQLWLGKTYVPTWLRDLALTDPRGAFTNSLADAQRQLPTDEELCLWTWRLAFKARAPGPWLYRCAHAFAAHMTFLRAAPGLAKCALPSLRLAAPGRGVVRQPHVGGGGAPLLPPQPHADGPARRPAVGARGAAAALVVLAGGARALEARARTSAGWPCVRPACSVRARPRGRTGQPRVLPPALRMTCGARRPLPARLRRAPTAAPCFRWGAAAAGQLGRPAARPACARPLPSPPAHAPCGLPRPRPAGQHVPRPHRHAHPGLGLVRRALACSALPLPRTAATLARPGWHMSPAAPTQPRSPTQHAPPSEAASLTWHAPRRLFRTRPGRLLENRIVRLTM
jgi:hypothetical protein